MKFFIKAIVTTGILLFIVHTFDVNIKLLFSGIINLKYLLFVFLFPLFILPIISANRWKVFLLQVSIDENILSLIRINFISIFQGIILPSSQGQDLMRIYNIEKLHPDKCGEAGSTIIIERMIGFVILCILSLSFSMFYKDIPNKNITVVIIGIITFVLFFIILLLLNKNLSDKLSKKTFSNRYLNKLLSYFTKICKSIAYFPYKNVLFTSACLILIFQLSNIIVIHLIFKSFGFNISLYQHISVYPIISILSMIPISISGLGIREGFFVYFYSKYGISPHEAITISLVNYAFIILIPTFIGSVLYLFENKEDKSLRLL